MEVTPARIGTMMMVSWALLLGPLGGVLLLGIAYAMMTGNLALGAACSVFVFIPMLLTLVWGGSVVRVQGTPETSSGLAAPRLPRVSEAE